MVSDIIKSNVVYVTSLNYYTRRAYGHLLLAVERMSPEYDMSESIIKMVVLDNVHP